MQLRLPFSLCVSLVAMTAMTTDGQRHPRGTASRNVSGINRRGLMSKGSKSDGKGKKSGGKGKKGEEPPFTNPPGEEECIAVQETVTIVGSGTPIAGPTKAAGACAVDFPPQNDINEYLGCLTEEGVINGKWWFNRDVGFNEFFFDNDQVCAAITGTDPSSKTKFELWDFDLIDKPLSDFQEFSVDYSIINDGGSSSVAYVNVYLRATNNTNFYDCRIDFLAAADATGDTGTILIQPSTVTSSGNLRTAGLLGCSSPFSIESFLTANPDAVLGVGNSEGYTFTLDTGSTGESSDGLQVCWKDVKLQILNEDGTSLTTIYEFAEGIEL